MERIKCLCGMEADARVMFEIEADEKIKIAFQQAAFEDEKEEIEAAIGEERYLIIENMKQLYDYSQLQSVLNGFDYLSDARVQMYEKHKEDLHLLKKVYRKIWIGKCIIGCSAPEKREVIVRIPIPRIQWILWQKRKSTEEI